MRVSVRALFALCLVISIGTGCASYTTPGRGADLTNVGLTEQARNSLSDPMVHATLELKPLAAFPTAIAVARIQAPGYRSPTSAGWGGGQYSLVTSRDVEKEEHFSRLARLPMVNGVAPISRLLLPDTLSGDLPLRQAAARLHADLLLIYTFDTTFSHDDAAAPLSVISLGLSPTKTVRVTTTVSAMLIDTRNAYLYGLAEATAQRNKLACSWTARDAMDQARRNNESEAFDKLVQEFEKIWSGVVTQYAKAR